MIAKAGINCYIRQFIRYQFYVLFDIRHNNFVCLIPYIMWHQIPGPDDIVYVLKTDSIHFQTFFYRINYDDGSQLEYLMIL